MRAGTIGRYRPRRAGPATGAADAADPAALAAAVGPGCTSWGGRPGRGRDRLLGAAGAGRRGRRHPPGPPGHPVRAGRPADRPARRVGRHRCCGWPSSTGRPATRPAPELPGARRGTEARVAARAGRAPTAPARPPRTGRRPPGGAVIGPRPVRGARARAACCCSAPPPAPAGCGWSSTPRVVPGRARPVRGDRPGVAAAAAGGWWRPSSAPPPEPPAGRRTGREPDDGLIELTALEHRLSWGSVDADRFRERVRPVLVDLDRRAAAGPARDRPAAPAGRPAGSWESRCGSW